MKNIRIFYLKNCHFLVVTFSVYLNRRVFVMYLLNSKIAFILKTPRHEEIRLLSALSFCSFLLILNNCC